MRPSFVKNPVIMLSKCFILFLVVIFPLVGHTAEESSQQSNQSLSRFPTVIDTFEDHFEDFAKSEKWEEIIVLGTAALDIAKKTGRIQDEARICARLTSTSFYQGNYIKALEYAHRCHEISEAFDAPCLFLRALYLESAVYRALASKDSDESTQQALYCQAVATAEAARDLFVEKAVDDQILKGKIYFNLGAAHADNPKGDLDKAACCYSIALDCFQSDEAIDDLVRTSIRLGKIHLLKGDCITSQKIIDAIRHRISTHRIAMHVNYLEAQIKLALKEYTQAQKLAQEGLAIAKDLGAKEDLLRFANLLQMVQAKMQE